MLVVKMDLSRKRRRKGIIKMQGELTQTIREVGWVVHALWQQVPEEAVVEARAAILEEIKMQMRRD